MKFYIDSVYHHKPENMIKTYPCLKKYGFDCDHIRNLSGEHLTYPYIILNDLEQLMILGKELDEELIINGETSVITIYDGYIA